ncbi:MAG TPA: SDR family NAD(P)-dependent oxidoreductase [Actinomycetota bacterium]|nr:SDR family NAD(P)-dependent oxidoreductase [Actinomycetota bacterium]
MRVLVTGAASGFGLAVAARLRARGDDVRGLDVRAAPGVLVADVRDQDEVDRAVGAAATELGGLDVVVNNAGVGVPVDAGARPGPEALAALETNFLGAWRVTAAALPALLESRGRVVNVASALASMTIPLTAAYAASKRALVAYSDALRLEYGDRVTVTTVYPGFVRTPIHRPAEAMGVSLAGAVPEEPLERAVGAIVRAATGRPRRDVATSLPTAAATFAARHFPGTTDRVVRAHVRRLARRGHFDRSELRPPMLGR